MIPYTENSRKCQLTRRDRKQALGAEGWDGLRRAGEGGSGLQRGIGSVWGWWVCSLS